MGIDPVSIGAGAALDIGGALLSNRFAAERQHDTQDFTGSMFANRYQIQTRDLMDAGLNPMLAYMNGAPAGPGSSAAPTAKLDLASAYNQVRATSAQVANVEADTKNKNATSALIDAQTDVQKSSADNNRVLFNKLTAEVENTKQQLDNLKAEADKTRWSTISESKYQDLQDKLMLYYSALAKLTGKESAILDPKVSAARSWSGSAAAHGSNISKALGPLSDIVGGYLRMGGPRFGGIDLKGPNDYK